jgi:hypothetical protein
MYVHTSAYASIRQHTSAYLKPLRVRVARPIEDPKMQVSVSFTLLYFALPEVCQPLHCFTYRRAEVCQLYFALPIDEPKSVSFTLLYLSTSRSLSALL